MRGRRPLNDRHVGLNSTARYDLALFVTDRSLLHRLSTIHFDEACTGRLNDTTHLGAPLGLFTALVLLDSGRVDLLRKG